MVSNNWKSEKIKDFPNVLKVEIQSINALQKGIAEIAKVKEKEVKTKVTPLTGVAQVYDGKTEMTEKFTRLFNYVSTQ